ncbi:MAG: DNA polymerase III subunit beta, partial [Deltaproteobacteria bacterium]|nr:DNA polymerase III subunit beta [Deltaproteobacteria bacterium]
MKIVLDRADFLRALEFQVSKETRSLSDVYTLVLLSTDSGVLKLRSTNGEQLAESWSQAEIIKAGSAALKYDLLYDLIKNLSTREVILEVVPEEQKAFILSGKSKYRLSLFDQSDLLLFHAHATQHLLTISCLELKKVLMLTSFVAKGQFLTDDVGKLLISQIDKDTIEFASSDSIRLCLLRVRFKGIKKIDTTAIPVQSLEAVRNYCSCLTDEDLIEIWVSDKFLTLKSEYANLSVLKTSTKFVDYNAFRDLEFGVSLIVSVSDMEKALKRLLGVTGEARLIKLIPRKDKLVLFSRSAVMGDGEEEVDAEALGTFSENNEPYMFNGAYLHDFFRLQTENERARLDFSNPQSVLKLRFED